MPVARRKKFFRGCTYALYLVLSVLCLLEISYRFYLVDFYNLELRGLNDSLTLIDTTSNPIILAMGDSFTADPESYVRTIRNEFSNSTVINSAVPGTSIREAILMAPRRIKKYKPKAFIYQIYVGNDLIEYNPPTFSKNISIARRCYWWLSGKIQVLRYLNFRFRFIRQLFHANVESGTPKTVMKFSPESYAPRTKLLFQADPYGLENCIFLKNGRDQDMQYYLSDLKILLSCFPEDCPVFILVIPHCIQISALYRDRMLRLGAALEYPEDIFNETFTFYQKLLSEINRKSIFFINALPILQHASSINAVYYENDPHLNPHGQEVLGENLVQIVRKYYVNDINTSSQN
jgi:hypothetical protein